MFKNNFYLFIFLLFFYSCQPVELIDKIIFDYDNLSQITLSANQKDINNLYESRYIDSYIDNSLKHPPVFFLTKWLDYNIDLIGNENKFEVNILESSLKKSEIKNNELKKYQEKTIFLFEVKYLVEFILFSDNNSVLGTLTVEVKRTTTSSKFISIQENDNIISYLILDCLNEFSKKSEELIKIHLKNYVL
jgi:hypothetical protein